jgi:UDP-GlcNAc:undecaprenyl-phosphate GlcNAc-1-phosphate transferase
MEVRLQGSRDWRQLWTVLTEEAERLDLQQLLLDVNAPALHEGYHARWDKFRASDESPILWRFEIPLSADGHAVGRLEIAGQPEGTPEILSKIEILTRLVEGHVTVNSEAGLNLDDLTPVVAPPVAAGGLN